MWLGIHFLDLVNFIMAANVVKAAGFTANVGGQPIDTEDAAAAALRCASHYEFIVKAVTKLELKIQSSCMQIRMEHLGQ
eukprot:SAG31_NODE_388_length_16371_cov_5.228982_10_plen_79_part_00